MCHQPFSYIVSLALNYARESDLPRLIHALKFDIFAAFLLTNFCPEVSYGKTHTSFSSVFA